MNVIIERLESLGSWKEVMRGACKNNRICTSFAGQLTPGKLKQLRQRFKKAYQNGSSSFSECWIQHEMRAFNWILIAISSDKNVRIEEFGPQEYATLYQVFDMKTQIFLRYETQRFLLEKKAKNKNWAPDENQTIIEIIARYDSDKIIWNQVARKMFEESSEKYFRTAKHCREHWFNYLDPSKKRYLFDNYRGQWTTQQDLQLLEKVKKEGKRWAKIGSEFQRTQHNVKNRYNAIISKQKKQNPKMKNEVQMEVAKKSFSVVPQQQKDERVVHPIKINLKMSSESIYNENRSEPYMTFHEIEPKNPLDLIHPDNPEGEQHIKNLLKEDDNSARNDPQGHFSFWSQSPQNLTPLGFSPSPFGFNMNLNYYIQNFNMQLQRQGSKEEGKE